MKLSDSSDNDFDIGGSIPKRPLASLTDDLSIAPAERTKRINNYLSDNDLINNYLPSLINSPNSMP